MNYELIEKVVHAYGKTLESIMSDDVIYKYPGMNIPESLLPYPKKIVEWALVLWENKAGNEGDLETANSLASSRIYLERFIPDQEVPKNIGKLLENNNYLETIFKASITSSDSGYKIKDIE